MKVRPLDLLLVLIPLTLAALLWVFLRPQGAGAVAVVTVDGVEQGRYALSEDCTVPIESGDGGYNLLVIADGTARITQANCGDHTCVRTGAISLTGQSIICLPHKVVIRIEGGAAGDVDLSTH